MALCLLSHRTRARSSPCTQVGQRPRAATRSDRVRVRPARAGSAALAASSSSGTALSLEAARVALAHTKAACIWGLACASAPSRRWRALARASAPSRRLRPSCRSAAFSPGACTPASPPRARAAHLCVVDCVLLSCRPRPNTWCQRPCDDSTHHASLAQTTHQNCKNTRYALTKRRYLPRCSSVHTWWTSWPRIRLIAADQWGFGSVSKA